MSSSRVLVSSQVTERGQCGFDPKVLGRPALPQESLRTFHVCVCVARDCVTLGSPSVTSQLTIISLTNLSLTLELTSVVGLAGCRL